MDNRPGSYSVREVGMHTSSQDIIMNKVKVTLETVQKCLDLCQHGKAKCTKTFVNGDAQYEVVSRSGKIQLSLTKKSNHDYAYLFEAYLQSNGDEDGLFKKHHQTTKIPRATGEVNLSPTNPWQWEYGD